MSWFYAHNDIEGMWLSSHCNRKGLTNVMQADEDYSAEVLVKRSLVTFSSLFGESVTLKKI